MEGMVKWLSWSGGGRECCLIPWWVNMVLCNGGSDGEWHGGVCLEWWWGI